MTEPGPSGPPPLPDTFHTDLSVGEILRRTRTHYGITFDQVEQDLRIRAEHIEAIEHNAVENLPGRVYVFGFIRTYAEYLGLDGEKIVQLFKRQSGRKVEKVRHVATMPMEDEEQKTPGWMVVTASAVALLLAMVVIGSATTQDVPEEIPPVSKQLSDQLTVPAKPQPAQQPVTQDMVAKVLENQMDAVAAAQPPAPAAHPVVLKALDNTWLEIRDAQRKVVFSRVLSRGEEYWVPPEQTDLSMTLGNAGGLQIVVEGEAMPVLGAKGQVRRNVLLDPARLKAALKPAAARPKAR